MAVGTGVGRHRRGDPTEVDGREGAPHLAQRDVAQSRRKVEFRIDPSGDRLDLPLLDAPLWRVYRAMIAETPCGIGAEHVARSATLLALSE